MFGSLSKDCAFSTSTLSQPERDFKMDDLAKSGAGLEVSVSFGRFENDALSWEKWSSFSPNKYLEEVGSLSTPGSVAQKKAYFEAHYKKIAARKAEELEQDRSTNPLSPSPDVSSKEDHIQDSSQNDTESSLSRDSSSVEEVVEEACVAGMANFVIADDSARSPKEDELVASINGMIDSIASKEEKGVSVDLDSESPAVQETISAKDANVDIPGLNVNKDAFSVMLETPQKDTKEPQRKKGFKQSSVLKKENSKLNSRNIPQKVTPRTKERNLPATTPRPVKPTSISTPISTHQSLKKKVNSSAKPNIKSSEAVQSKRVAPTSLHMSLSLGPADSMGAIPMTRKSLIMESMGDKDIVKRAFKTFQNRTNGFATNEKPTKHASSTASEPKTSSYHTPTKGTEGLRKDAEMRASQRSQSGTRSNPLSSGLSKSTSLDKKSPSLSPATGLRSDEKSEKRKEFLKKLGAKSIAREAENAQHSARQRKTRSINMLVKSSTRQELAS